MNRRNWIAGVAAGLLVGLIVASIVTYLDWRQNPGDVFRDSAGTRWSAVVETGVSWLLPVAALTGGCVWLALVAHARWR